MLLFSTSKILCSYFPLPRQRHFEFGISCLQLKMTSLCFKPSWLNGDEWPLHSVRAQGMHSARGEQSSHGNIANCKIYKAYLNKFLSFFIVMKTKSFFPPTYFIKLFTTSVKFASLKILFHYHICLRIQQNIFTLFFLKMQYPPISFSYENLNFYCNCTVFSIKYQWTWFAKQTLLYNETVKIEHF